MVGYSLLIPTDTRDEKGRGLFLAEETECFRKNRIIGHLRVKVLKKGFFSCTRRFTTKLFVIEKKNREHLFTHINSKNINIVEVKTKMQKLCAIWTAVIYVNEKTMYSLVRFYYL